ncbi:MAG TPA: phosphoribosylformylglycinamidine synthase I [Armatimonadetes bacterium]|nr:phosphoribosylformylglycinamidine synthase I [Armatimonadota bacterium]
MAERKRIAVLQFPGSNCEVETARAVEAAGLQAEIFRWNRDPAELARFDGYILGGGFSYQDRVRAGVIAAKEPILEVIVAAAAEGKPVLGICNGAQILVETGLVPGVNDRAIDMALAPNRMVQGGRVVRRDYYCAWVYVKLSCLPERCLFTQTLPPKAVFPLPIAHGEGRFVTRREGLRERLWAQDQIVFRYCTPEGEVLPDFPVNPNGAVDNLAGLCNPAGNVLALMPHPERASWLRQVPADLPDHYGQRRREATGNWAALEEPGPGRALFEALKRFGEA